MYFEILEPKKYNVDNFIVFSLLLRTLLLPWNKSIIICMDRNNIPTVNKPSSLLSYWTKEWKVFLIIAVTGIIYNFGMLANPYFEGVLIDYFLDPTDGKMSIYLLVGIFVFSIFLVQIARSLKRYFVRIFADDVVTMMRKTLYNNLLHESFHDLENENMGVLLNRLNSDCHQAVEGMRKLTTEIFDTVFLFFFYIVYLFFFDVKMTLFALIPVAVAIVISFLLRKQIYLSSSRKKEANASLSSITYSLMDHAWMYRLYSRDEENEKIYDKALKDYERKSVKADVLVDITLPICNVISLLGLIPILYLGIGYINDVRLFSLPIPYIMGNTWTIGFFSTYITTFILLSSKASHTSKLFSSVEKGLSSWKRIKPYIRPYGNFSRQKKREGNELSFDDFGVMIDGKPLFDHLSLNVHRGQIIALTGGIASGKTAFGKVFIHELDYKGSVILFDKEVKDYDMEEIKGNVSYMGHRNDLMTKSIKENIAFGQDEDVMPYLYFVSFEKDLLSMPEKEETIIGNEGVRLSGGQQERIALARTMYNRKGLVILDDPFASVDMKTEHEIMRRLRDECKDSIVLFFSHRLSYFPYCDKVIVINDDHTFSIGSHDELLKDNPTYQKLYTLQKIEVEHE